MCGKWKRNQILKNRRYKLQLGNTLSPCNLTNPILCNLNLITVDNVGLLLLTIFFIASANSGCCDQIKL